MRLLGEIAVLLGVYKLHILAVGDCLTDVSTTLVFVCKNRVSMAEFQHIDGSARWLTSFNYNPKYIYALSHAHLVYILSRDQESCNRNRRLSLAAVLVILPLNAVVPWHF